MVGAEGGVSGTWSCPRNPKSLGPAPQVAEIPPRALTCARQHLHLLRPALGEGHTPQHELDVVTGLGQPVAPHVPTEGGGPHPAGIVSPPTPINSPGTASPPPTWDHRQQMRPGALSGSLTGSPKLLPLVQGIQEVVGHDILSHQVVTDGSWKRGSSPSSPNTALSPSQDPANTSCPPRATYGHPGSMHWPEGTTSSRLPPQTQVPVPAGAQSHIWGVPLATASSPHSASFMPVSTSPSFGGSTPGVSTRYIRGFSHTWDGGGRAVRTCGSITNTVDSDMASERGVELFP